MLKILQRLFIVFISISSVAAQAPYSDSDKLLIQDFITDIANEKIRPDVILSKYVALQQTVTDEQYDYLEASIEEVRINLQPKNIDEIEYVPFTDMPKREIRDIDTEGKPTDKMFFLRYRNRHMLAIFILEDKIGSFTLVSKGNKAHFVTY